MLRRKAVAMAVIVCVLAFPSISQAQEKLQNHFSKVAVKVKATDDPAEKRQLLEASLEDMSKALDQAQGSPLISKDDKSGIDRLAKVVKDKQDELAGVNGYDGVPDAQLNAFADYVVQDMEQAEQYVRISLVALLLIIIIVLLLA